jgi:hypothetical protein
VGSSLVVFLSIVMISITLILLLFLIDKVKKIEDIAQQLINSINNQTSNGGSPKLDASFNNLNGMALWDVLCGKVDEGTELPTAEVEVLRAKFRPLFEKHLRHLFSSGLQDAKAGKPKSLPKNQKTYNTLRGEVTIWTPAQQTSTLYNAGFEFANADADAARRVASNVQECLQDLHSAVKMEVSPTLMNNLITLPG